MTKWELTKQFFGSPKRIFTRREFILYVESHGHKFYPLCSFDRYRCALRNAGYIEQQERGVYRKVKKIPNKLSSSDIRLMEKAKIAFRRFGVSI